jgi:hypothetical protein
VKRDMELVRKLLLFFEAKPDQSAIENVEIDGYDREAIGYHLILLYEADLIAAEPYVSKTSNRIIDVLPFRLTWEGHEFLAAARNDSVWFKARSRVASLAGDVPFTLLKDLLVHALRARADGGAQGA